MDLFYYMRQTNQEKEAPLAARLRPRTLDEVVGQQHIIGKDKLLYRAIQADKLSSIIFYGPPGTGKTTLARVIANTTSAEFMQINATVAGKKDMEEVVAKAKDNRGMFGKKTILDGKIHLTLEVAQECIQKRAVKYDKTGDNHYDTISAFIKSMRGSDPDAAVYYLARMLYAGESVTFIARRMMICASEDVGNADPTALQVAVSASLASERVGMPEAQIILAQAAAYIACAPKSNAAVNAIASAMKTVEETGNLAIPVHLQDAHYKGAAKLGHGKDYKYAHDYPNHYVRQQYLPYELSGREFYQPGGMGYEVKIKEHMQRIRREAAKTEQKPQDGAEQ